jgi:hypothetical protein
MFQLPETSNRTSVRACQVFSQVITPDVLFLNFHQNQAKLEAIWIDPGFSFSLRPLRLRGSEVLGSCLSSNALLGRLLSPAFINWMLVPA